MIIKITNKNVNFYRYMGKFFGSRLVENQLHDRIYDDDGKEWYISIEQDHISAFVSVQKNIIKNVYSIKEAYLEDILKKIKKEKNITYSIVTNRYIEIYRKCGFNIYENSSYKNFVTIYM